MSFRSGRCSVWCGGRTLTSGQGAPSRMVRGGHAERRGLILGPVAVASSGRVLIEDWRDAGPDELTLPPRGHRLLGMTGAWPGAD